MAVSSPRESRFEVPTRAELERLAAEPLPLRLRSSPVVRSFHRDLFLDTADDSLAQRGVTCRFRLGADDRRRLTLRIAAPPGSSVAGERFDVRVEGADVWQALDGNTPPARRLRGLIDPSQLDIVAQVETERRTRRTKDGFFGFARFEFLYDIGTVRHAGLCRSFQQLSIRRFRRGGVRRADLERAIIDAYGLRPTDADTRMKAQLLVKWMEHEADAIATNAPRAVVLLGQRNGTLAFQSREGRLAVPLTEGAGEETCRRLMRTIFGVDDGQLVLAGTVPARARRPMLEIWLAPEARGGAASSGGAGLEWLSLERVMSLMESGTPLDPATMAAVRLLARSRAGAARPAAVADSGTHLVPVPAVTANGSTPAAALALLSTTSAGDLIPPESSELEFNRRVVELADDPDMPLLERLRFLAISESNLDELFMVRIAALRAAEARAPGDVLDEDDGAPPTERLRAFRRRVPGLMRRQREVWRGCRAALETQGIRVVTWSQLDEAQRETLREYAREEILPLVTPMAITISAGHPFPVQAHLALSVAVMIRAAHGAPHLAQIDVPAELPRFVRPGRDARDFVPVEEVIRGSLDLLYPHARVEAAWAFRVTRSRELKPVAGRGSRLLEAVEEAASRRTSAGVIRVEVEHEMPQMLREVLLKEMLREPDGIHLRADDVYEVDGLLDLGALRELAALDLPALRFPRLRPRSPLDRARSLWEQIRERDVLVHHPYDDFETTVLRFFEEAADDDQVASIKLTLYRAGKKSPVVEALRRAARSGKDVAVFVELKARFDEAHNVRWARRLENAGVHVVYGLKGYKTHAKVALVVRREEGKLRRYAHVGTGNYNVDTAAAYTDLGLLTADEAITADVSDLFNALTGSSLAPSGAPRACLVAPQQMAGELLRRIAREAAHARRGRPARIRAKLNGLSDAELIDALYDASRAGVEIDLIVRGICSLRPGVPGMSERIRVVSCLGRFLEHARIVHFANDGASEFFIGSADWRRRNLRRRVELLAPVRDARWQGELDRLLELELGDPRAWELGPTGSYARRRGSGPAAQAQLLAGLA